MENRKLYETDIEKIMRDALIEADIDFTSQFPIRGSYILDFAIPKLKIDVEVDGENFHPIGNNYDRKRNWFLRNRGWTILRFRGNEIKNNIQSCISEINRVVRRLKEDEKNKS